MSNLARQELYFRRFYSLDEILASIEAVTREQLQSLAQQYFRSGRHAVTVLGNLNGFALDRARLELLRSAPFLRNRSPQCARMSRTFRRISRHSSLTRSSLSAIILEI